MSGAVVVKERCHAITKRRGLNTRCKHTTLRGQFCWQHGQTDRNLRIKKSEVAPRAGMGLFAVKPIKKNSQIALYTGDRVVTADPNFGNPYVLQIKKNTFIDAKKTNEKGEGRWANDKKDRSNNANLVYNTRTKKAYLKANRNIPAKKEITTAYGPQYWRHYGAKAPRKVVAKRVRE